ncbi:MAG: RNA polymerase sigma factor [Bacillota bacterium]|nr:RNA polymerase sigma factor [Bacillota bacterium]
MKDDFLERIDDYMIYVYNIALKMLGDEDAKDAAQDAIIKAYQNIDTFRGECALSTWLYRITVNECKDFIRKRRTFIPIDEIIELEGGVLPEVELERVENAKLLDKALQYISVENREILILREMLGYEYKEISSELGIPEGTVKSRINRAKKNLKNAILSLTLYGGTK